jgi:hypothetical protein
MEPAMTSNAARTDADRSSPPSTTDHTRSESVPASSASRAQTSARASSPAGMAMQIWAAMPAFTTPRTACANMGSPPSGTLALGTPYPRRWPEPAATITTAHLPFNTSVMSPTLTPGAQRTPAPWGAGVLQCRSCCPAIGLQRRETMRPRPRRGLRRPCLRQSFPPRQARRSRSAAPWPACASRLPTSPGRGHGATGRGQLLQP